MNVIDKHIATLIKCRRWHAVLNKNVRKISHSIHIIETEWIIACTAVLNFDHICIASENNGVGFYGTGISTTGLSHEMSRDFVILLQPCWRNLLMTVMFRDWQNAKLFMKHKVNFQSPLRLPMAQQHYWLGLLQTQWWLSSNPDIHMTETWVIEYWIRPNWLCLIKYSSVCDSSLWWIVCNVHIEMVNKALLHTWWVFWSINLNFFLSISTGWSLHDNVIFILYMYNQNIWIVFLKIYLYIYMCVYPY